MIGPNSRKKSATWTWILAIKLHWVDLIKVSWNVTELVSIAVITMMRWDNFPRKSIFFVHYKFNMQKIYKQYTPDSPPITRHHPLQISRFIKSNLPLADLFVAKYVPFSYSSNSNAFITCLFGRHKKVCHNVCNAFGLNSDCLLK